VFYVTGADNTASLHLHAALGFQKFKRLQSDRSAAGKEVLPQPAKAAEGISDRDILAAGSAFGQFDGPLDSISHEREGGSALPLQDLPAAVGHHEHRRPERRLVTLPRAVEMKDICGEPALAGAGADGRQHAAPKSFVAGPDDATLAD
jgi:hypothetical protein